MKSGDWRLTPSEFLNELGWQFKQRGHWLTLPLCPFCEGGDRGDRNTFVVDTKDGNFSCSRSKCGVGGTFWGLIEAAGRDPRAHFGERQQIRSKVRPTGFIYGR